MNEIEIIVLSVALAIDAMLVSFSYGLILTNKRMYNSLLLSVSFGFFQFLMPIIGYYFSALFYSKLELFSKWIVFIIFIILSWKFLKSAFETEKEKVTCISLLCLFCLALATSIDAMGAGISFRFMKVDYLTPSVNIGVITFLLSFFGFWVANIFKKMPSKPIEITGAVLLIYLAIKAIL